MTAFKAEQRVDDSITDIRARAALRAAIVTALTDLEPWADAQLLLGLPTLADVPAPLIDGESRLVMLWRRAIFSFAKAEIAEVYRDYDTTGKGVDKNETMDDTIAQFRRDGRHAVRDMLGKPRVRAELI